MNWAGKQHPVEMLIEWIAPFPLALAAAWAGRTLGFSFSAAAAVAVAAYILGFVAIRRTGRENRARSYGFEPAKFEKETDELLLGPQDEVLILDDPLDVVPSDSRVVRLFAPHDPTPGELVERIADFLGEDRCAVLPVQVRAEPAPPADASAALHAALANIRASLR